MSEYSTKIIYCICSYFYRFLW